MTNTTVQTAETKKTMTIVEKQQKDLAKQAGEISKMMAKFTTLTSGAENKMLDTVNSLTEISGGLTTEIQLKAGELASITDTSKEALRRSKAELVTQIAENKRTVLTGLLNEFDLAEITSTELTQIKGQLNGANRDIKEEVSKAVSAAVSNANSANELNVIKATGAHQVAVAQLESSVTSLQDRNADLVKALGVANTALDAERNARVESARATGAPTFNVPTAK